MRLALRATELAVAQLRDARAPARSSACALDRTSCVPRHYPGTAVIKELVQGLAFTMRKMLAVRVFTLRATELAGAQPRDARAPARSSACAFRRAPLTSEHLETRHGCSSRQGSALTLLGTIAVVGRELGTYVDRKCAGARASVTMTLPRASLPSRGASAKLQC